MTKDKYSIRITHKGYYYAFEHSKVLRGQKRKMTLYHGGYYNAKEEKWQMKYRNYFGLAIWHNPLY